MDEAPKFEEGLAALEKLVAELEAGDLGLDEALKRFEKGVKIAGQMQKSLEDTGRRIEKLGADGLSPMDGGDAEGGEDGGAEHKQRKGKAGKTGKPGVDPTLF
ncbi:MAG TPA: exodeoxyribonuclease VII small subunit [bacterium]|jgi:exodeoxyribonuclease VII small subunit|nr:exodeoxyribonuclease VII small subunit [bacterium]